MTAYEGHAASLRRQIITDQANQIARLTAERDRARDIAVALEQENAVATESRDNGLRLLAVTNVLKDARQVGKEHVKVTDLYAAIEDYTRVVMKK